MTARTPSSTVAPARILKIVRDHGPLTTAAIVEHLGHAEGSQRLLPVADQVDALLQRFQAAGLVAKGANAAATTGGSDVLLSQSMTPAAVRRALELAKSPGALVTWEMTDGLLLLQRALGLRLADLALQQEREADPLVNDLKELSQRLANPPSEDPLVRDQLVPCLSEVSTCLAAACYAAALSLAGKALELVIKRQLMLLGDRFDDNLMLGALLRRLRELSAVRTDISAALLDPALGHVANLINQHRVAAVHGQRAVAPPNEDQARVALHALLDVVRRSIVTPGPAAPPAP